MPSGKIQTTKDDVESFLKYFKEKLKTFSIIYEVREKNKQALLDLEITPQQRTDFLNELEVDDYYRGPTKDSNDTSNPDYWEFGKSVNGKEVYIKINFGKTNRPVICISFHVAERPITYKFR